MRPLRRGALAAAIVVLGGSIGAATAQGAGREASCGGPWGGSDLHRPALREAAAPDLARPLDEVRLSWRVDAAAGRIDAVQRFRVHNHGTAPLASLRWQLLPELIGGELRVGEARIDGAGVTSERRDGWWLELALPRPLAPGEAVEGRIAYEVDVPAGETPGWGLLARRGGVWSLAHAFPARLPRGRPAHRPSLAGDLLAADAARYCLRLDLPAEWTALGSGTVVSRRPGAEGRQVVEMVTGPARDLYLLLARPGVLQRQVAHVDGVTLRGFAPAEARDGMAAAVRDAGTALTALEARYGAYPYAELDLAAIDTNALGIEFPGVALLARSLLARGESPTLRATTVHEVAHQWFYNLVGNDQVREPWLDESVTQYVTLRVLATAFGEAEGRAFRRELVRRWRGAELRPERIDRPVAAYADGDYVPIVYGRGPLLLEAAARRVGPEAFDRLLRRWVADHRFAFADGDDLLARIEAACDCALNELAPATSAP